MIAQEFQNTEVARLYSDINSHKITAFLNSYSNRVTSIVEDSENGEDREIKLALLANYLGSNNAATKIGEFLRETERTWYAISSGRTESDKQYHTIFDVGLIITHGSGLVLPLFSNHECAQKYYKSTRESLSPNLQISKSTLYDLCDMVGRKTHLSINPLSEPFCAMISASITEQIAIGLGVRDVQGEWLSGEGAALSYFKSVERLKPLFEMDEDTMIEEMRGALTMAAMSAGNYLDYFQIAVVAYNRCPERARSDSGYWITGQRASQNKRALKWAQDNLNNQPEDPLSHAYLGLALLQIDPVVMREDALYYINAALQIDPGNFVAKMLLQGLNK